MSNQVDYFIQIFKTLGVPLTSAVLGRAGAQGSLDSKQTTQAVAELLTKSVQSGIDLGAIIQLAQHGEKAETARLSLTSLAGQIHSEIYKSTGSTVQPNDMQTITDGLKTAMQFSQSFEASPESTLRAQQLDNASGADKLQSQLQLLNSFTPIMQLLALSPITQTAAPQAAQDIFKRLSDTANELNQSISGKNELSADTSARHLLQTICQLYSACYKAELNSAAPSHDNIWKNFDLQIQILEALTQSIVPGYAPKAKEQTPEQAPAQAEQPAIPPTPAEHPATQPAQMPASPPSDSPVSPPASTGTGSPMGFFSNKPADTEPQQAEQASPIAPPPQAEQPAIPPTPAEQPATQPEQMPASPPSDSPVSSPASTGTGSPMSFFSGKKKDNDESSDN